MKKSFLALSLATTLFAGTVFSGQAYAADKAVPFTRGEYMHAIVQQLEATPKDKNSALPKDVSAESPYAETVRVMKEKKIVFGYEDGTFKLDQPVSVTEAEMILSRVLGIAGVEASDILSKQFGVSFGSDAIVTKEEALGVIKDALVIDPAILDLVNKSSVQSMKQQSFSMDMSQDITNTLNQKMPELNNVDRFSQSSDISMEYIKDKGLHMSMTATMPEILGEAIPSIKMEQYYVPEGIFMMMTNPETNKDEWINMTDVFPMSFEQLMAIQKDSIELNNKLLDKSFFYRDLGNVEVEGKKLKQVGFYGQISSMDEIMELFQGTMNNQEIAIPSIEETGLAGMSMYGTMLIDETTKLPMSAEYNISISFTPSTELPFKEMKMEMDADFKEYNQVKAIVLPEAAKNAKKIDLTIDPSTEVTPDKKAE
ncbi:S-layer homology domain-containing protein [Brevibacillus daliensis]|uniref:S-layer homology domain-containing protein n=1 Tax=Brevibacillus daliensis TaxID=2892995 RepID=UPI001E463BA2|nr:S-layer homology domain-containing protein [Brevibacillus daliensis]